MLLAADNLNSFKAVLARALEEFDAGPIQDLVRRCNIPEVSFLDLNPGFLSKRQLKRMAFFGETVQDVTDKRLILDSPSPEVLSTGLKSCRKTPILSALSLERKKMEEILPLALEHGTELIVLPMDEHSRVPPTAEERIAIALEVRDAATAAGMEQSRLIFDPVLPNLSWPDAYSHIREAIKTVRLLSGFSIFPEPARTMVGLSNLRSTLRKKIPFAFEADCLALLAGAGLELALADILQAEFLPFLRG